MEVFGSGGGQAVSDSLSTALGAPVPLLGQIPLDPRLRESGDDGVPLVLSAPETRRRRRWLGWPTGCPPARGGWPACRSTSAR